MPEFFAGGHLADGSRPGPYDHQSIVCQRQCQPSGALPGLRSEQDQYVSQCETVSEKGHGRVFCTCACRGPAVLTPAVLEQMQQHLDEEHAIPDIARGTESKSRVSPQNVWLTGYALPYSLLLLPNPSSCIGIGRWLEQLYVPFYNPALSVV